MKSQFSHDSISEREIRRQYYNHEAARTKNMGRVIGLIISAITFAALYVDYRILQLPMSVIVARLLTFICYLSYILFTLTSHPISNKKIIRYYSFCLLMGMAFAVFFNIVLYQWQDGIYSYRAIHVLLLYTLFTAVFSLGSKHNLLKIILVPLGFITLYFLIKRMGLSHWGRYFSVYAAAMLIIVYHKAFIRKDYAEFKLKILTQAHLDKLQQELEVHKNHQQALQDKANYDQLTGILNRSAGLEGLEHLFHRASEEGKPLSICYIDLDRLKKVNDYYGHQEGDRFIKTTVEIIQEELRADDLFTRLGGDEFLIILWNTSNTTAEKIWYRIERRFYYHNRKKNHPFIISASHGIETFFQHNYENINDLLEQADKKMYQEKKRVSV